MKATTFFIASVLVGCSGPGEGGLDGFGQLDGVTEEVGPGRGNDEDSYEFDGGQSNTGDSCGKMMKLPLHAPDGATYYTTVYIPCDPAWFNPGYPPDNQFEIGDWLKQFEFDDASVAVLQSDC